MNYINNIENKDLQAYLNILLSKNPYPDFIDKYIKTKELQRLKGIGFFCGCDYTKLFNLRFWYSRLDHSIACALMTWNFTKDKKQTITALLHDIGTPVFSHCIDIYLGDNENQCSGEIDVKIIIDNSIELKNCLKSDNIKIADISDYKKYNIIKNQIPDLCVDRLDGVLSTCFIWIKHWNIKNVEKCYTNLINIENEIVFKDMDIAKYFFDGVIKYAEELQGNKDKITLWFIARCLKYLTKKKKINFEDFHCFDKDEQYFVELIKSNNFLCSKWDIFVNSNKLIKTAKEPKEYFYVNESTKMRFVIPKVFYKRKILMLNEINKKVELEIERFQNSKDGEYAYLEIGDF